MCVTMFRLIIFTFTQKRLSKRYATCLVFVDLVGINCLYMDKDWHVSYTGQVTMH